MKKLLISVNIFAAITLIIYGLVFHATKTTELALIITLIASGIIFLAGAIDIIIKDTNRANMVYLSGLTAIIAYAYDTEMFANTVNLVAAVIFSIIIISVLAAWFAVRLNTQKTTAIFSMLLELGVIWLGRFILNRLLVA